MCSKQKVASVSPKLYVGNPTKNCNEIINVLDSLKNDNIDIIVFPELCLSGATCGDLFFHDTLINACAEGIKLITKYSKNCSSHIVIGAPVKENGILYSAACLCIVATNSQGANGVFSEDIISYHNIGYGIFFV